LNVRRCEPCDGAEVRPKVQRCEGADEVVRPKVQRFNGADVYKSGPDL